MAIRIDANPIGWSNDDLQDIGGDTRLETCLAEAKEGWVVIEAEQDPERANPLRYAGMGVAL